MDHYTLKSHYSPGSKGVCQQFSKCAPRIPGEMLLLLLLRWEAPNSLSGAL